MGTVIVHIDHRVAAGSRLTLFGVDGDRIHANRFGGSKARGCDGEPGKALTLVVESLAAGMTIPELVQAYPTLTEEPDLFV